MGADVLLHLGTAAHDEPVGQGDHGRRLIGAVGADERLGPYGHSLLVHPDEPGVHAWRLHVPAGQDPVRDGGEAGEGREVDAAGVGPAAVRRRPAQAVIGPERGQPGVRGAPQVAADHIRAVLGDGDAARLLAPGAAQGESGDQRAVGAKPQDQRVLPIDRWQGGIREVGVVHLPDGDDVGGRRLGQRGDGGVGGAAAGVDLDDRAERRADDRPADGNALDGDEQGEDDLEVDAAGQGDRAVRKPDLRLVARRRRHPRGASRRRRTPSRGGTARPH